MGVIRIVIVLRPILRQSQRERFSWVREVSSGCSHPQRESRAGCVARGLHQLRAEVNASQLPRSPRFPQTSAREVVSKRGPRSSLRGCPGTKQSLTGHLTTLPQMLLRLRETEKPDGEKDSRAITKS